jgi:hypothetical protein
MKKEEADTHQSHAPSVGAHQKLGEGVGVRLPQRNGHPPLEGVEGKRIRGHLRALPVSLRGHLPKRQPSLRQGKHPPTVDGGNHSRSGESPPSATPPRPREVARGSSVFRAGSRGTKRRWQQ